MGKAEPFFDPRDLLYLGLDWYRYTFLTMRCREVGLSFADWQAFGDALQEVYPAGRWLIDLRSRPWAHAERSYVLTEHLCALMEPMDRPRGGQPAGCLPGTIEYILDPDWQIEYVMVTGEGEFGDSARLKRRHFPSVRIVPGGFVLEKDRTTPERLRKGFIQINCSKGYRPHLAFARRFYRLFSRFATNRNQFAISYPSYEARVVEKGSYAWLGHDAIRWAREDPRRMLLFQQTHGFRPNDPDWSTALALESGPPAP